METHTRIRVAAREHGYRMQDVARMIGMSPSALSEAIRRSPSVDLLIKIADAIGAEIKDLIR